MDDFKASPKVSCNLGYYPIHEAARNASSKAMEVLLEFGEYHGCPRLEMISLCDADGNVPLHSAVHGGDVKAVELCINSGAKISSQQFDLSTPVHLACSQGALEIVKVMFTMSPLEKQLSLFCTDIQNMTPLHCASMIDHPELAEYLISAGANVNATDIERRTPLLLAASRGGWRTVHTLIKLGADLQMKDSTERNILHLMSRIKLLRRIVKSLEAFLRLLLLDRCISLLVSPDSRDFKGNISDQKSDRSGQLYVKLGFNELHESLGIEESQTTSQSH